MAEQQSEQNRSEEPTPFKLRRAREHGQVARSMEVGFLAGLMASIAFVLTAGSALMARLADLMRMTLTSGIDAASDPANAPMLIGRAATIVVQPVLLFAATTVSAVMLLELIQLRGFIFTGHPLKPDFSRINPAKGLKRLFSFRLVKETLKTLLKTAAYGIAVWLIVDYSVNHYAIAVTEGDGLIVAMRAALLRILFVFSLIALAFVAIDQLLVRSEFLKQMRMSRREVTREVKEREGDPRIRRKRKQLHLEFVRQSQGAANLAGSDMVIVNPQHYAVALRYDDNAMEAPTVTAMGRNRWALALKTRAFRLGIPVFERPALARALFRASRPGEEISAQYYGDVARLYFSIRSQGGGQ